jgi:hypothetical protein
MKALRTFLLLALIGFTVALAAQVIKSERYVQIWQNRVASLEHHEAQVAQITACQEYSGACLEATRMLAVENGLLCERDAKMTLYVAALQEENTKLKGVVAEGVEKMQEMLEENSELHREINNLSYKIRCLEQALEAASKPPEPTVDSIKNDILDILSSYIK